MEELQPWLFRVEPYEGESLSHFLGRFRRENELTPSGLGKAAGIGAVVVRVGEVPSESISQFEGAGGIGSGSQGRG